jgi:hydrogenase maturation protease
MAAPRVLILGIGNILWGDEGFGVRAVEEFHRLCETPENAAVIDGGTQGLYLVHFIEAHDHVLVFDAIDYGLEPGTLKLICDEAVPKFTGAKKMSLHQTGFQEVLSAADLLGRYPSKLALVGCQPLDLENWGGALTPPVRAAIAPALEIARSVLKDWGVALRPRTSRAPLLANDIDIVNYERRPGAAPALDPERGNA